MADRVVRDGPGWEGRLRETDDIVVGNPVGEDDEAYVPPPASAPVSEAIWDTGWLYRQAYRFTETATNFTCFMKYCLSRIRRGIAGAATSAS